MSKSPGLVIVNTFCQPDEKYFAGYIGYMDRPSAVRKEHIKDFDIFSGYMDYMGNPEKTSPKEYEEPERISALFTSDSNHTTAEEAAEMKAVFRDAQEKGSLLWQTVFSFDNSWLAEMNLYDTETRILDEKRIKNAARCAINTMLDKEDLGNAVWTAAIHYNTDNVHIHFGIVEPIPMRRTKVYAQYETVQIDGKWQYLKVDNPETGEKERVPILNMDGDILMKEEYVGRIKDSSLKAAKRVLLSEMDLDKDINKEITALIRDRILSRVKDMSLYEDEDFRERFVDICKALPENKGICNYGNNAMAHLRPEIDVLSDMYIEKYHADDFERLKAKLDLREEYYREAYGGEENNYAANKLQDLYYRLGNAILKEARQFDVEAVSAEPEINSGQLDPNFGDLEMVNEEQDYTVGQNPIGDYTLQRDKRQHIIEEPFFLDWKSGYKELRKKIYIEKKYAEALPKLQEMSEKGNVLAIFEMGNMYHFGRGVEKDEEKGSSYYAQALQGFGFLMENVKYTKYCSYRAGKQYLYGQGTEEDAEKAVYHLHTSAELKNEYAMYLLGNLYFDGRGVEQNTDNAVRYYREAAGLGNPYAQYKMGTLLEAGEFLPQDKKEANAYYKAALASFLEVEDKDEHLLYRIGTMYLKGRGTEIDYEKAAAYLEDAADLGNDMAQYQLGKLYLDNNDPEIYEKGVSNILKSANAGNQFAQYKMGQLSYKAGDKAGAKQWYAAAAAQGNEYAAKALYNLNYQGSYKGRGISYDLQKSKAELQRAMIWLKRSMDLEYEKYVNLQEYEQLQRDIQRQSNTEMELE